MSQYLDEEIFSGSLLFSGVALLKWCTKSSKFEEGFTDNGLSFSCSRSLHCVMLFLDNKLKGKIVLQQPI